MEDTLAVCPKCNGSGRIEPDESGYDGCDRCNYGEGPTGFVPSDLVDLYHESDEYCECGAHTKATPCLFPVK